MSRFVDNFSNYYFTHKAMIDVSKLNTILQSYQKEIGEDLISAIVVNRDGLPIASLSGGSSDLEEDVLGGLSALVDQVLNRFTQEFSKGSFGTGTFDTEMYRLIFCEAGADALFVTILDSLAMVDPVFPIAYLVAEKISRILDGRTVSSMIPKIISKPNIKNVERKVDQMQKLNITPGEYVYKLVLVGDGGVGKTSIVHQFVEGTFQESYIATIGTSIMKKECKFDGLGMDVRFIIWDLAGQQQFKRIRQSYLKNSEAGFLVYDVTRRKTFENIENWMKEISHAVEIPALILVGNKVDLTEQREVTNEEATALAEKLGVSYIETSAKTAENIVDAFKILALQLVNRYHEAETV